MASASCRRTAASGSPQEKSPFGLPDVFGAPYGREISVSLKSSLRAGPSACWSLILSGSQPHTPSFALSFSCPSLYLPQFFTRSFNH